MVHEIKMDSTNKFNTNSKQDSSYILVNRNYTIICKNDKPVGIPLSWTKGFAVITDPFIVINFNYSIGKQSGYDGITIGTNLFLVTQTLHKYTFDSPTDSNAQFDSIQTEYIQSVNVLQCLRILYVKQPQHLPKFMALMVNNPNNDPVYITEVGLYNKYGEFR